MKTLVIALGLALASAGGAAAQDAFQRPDCAAYTGLRAETRCVRDFKKEVRKRNAAGLQKSGLIFAYLARPDLAAYPAAQKAIGDRIEGAFTVRYSVKADGTVDDVRVEGLTSERLQPLADMMIGTVRRWTFLPPGKAVAGLEHRFVAVYAKDDDDRHDRDEHEGGY